MTPTQTPTEPTATPTPEARAREWLRANVNRDQYGTAATEALARLLRDTERAALLRAAQIAANHVGPNDVEWDACRHLAAAIRALMPGEGEG